MEKIDSLRITAPFLDKLVIRGESNYARSGTKRFVAVICVEPCKSIVYQSNMCHAERRNHFISKVLSADMMYTYVEAVDCSNQLILDPSNL